MPSLGSKFMNTLYLSRDRWDLALDASGNIALAKEPYAVAQDVASAIRLFRGELFYDLKKGVPYWSQVLGKFPPLGLIRERLRQAALSVPGVADASPILTRLDSRNLEGYIEVRLEDETVTTLVF